MAKAYSELSSQGVNRHIKNVKQEIDKEKAIAASPLVLDLEGGYTEQVIVQAEQHHRRISGSRERLEMLRALLKELETKALPAALAGEHRKKIAALEGNVAQLENRVEILRRRQTPSDLIEPTMQQLQQAQSELKQARSE